MWEPIANTILGLWLIIVPVLIEIIAAHAINVHSTGPVIVKFAVGAYWKATGKYRNVNITLPPGYC